MEPRALGDRIGRKPWHLWVAWLVIALLVAWLAERGWWLVREGKRRDFFEFFSGAEAMQDGRDPYDTQGLGYIYPPLLAFLLVPAVALGLPVATALWYALNMGVMLFSAWAVVRETVVRFGRAANAPLVSAAMAAALVLGSDKLRTELTMGQSNLLMVLSFVLGLLWLDRRPVLAGVALGFGANIKYLTLIAVPYLIVRGRWKAAAATVGATVGFALLPAVYVAWGTNLGYLRQALGGMVGMVGPAGTAGARTDSGATAKIAQLSESFSMSVTSWAARVCGGTNLWALLLTAGVAGAVLGAVWLIYRRNGVPLFAGRWREGEQRGVMPGVVAVEWTGLLVAALAFGPQTNARHLSMVLLPFAAAMAVLMLPRLRARGWPLMVGVAAVWLAIVLPPGSEGTRALRDKWQAMAGPSWCLLGMYLTLVWVAIRDVKARRHEAAAEPKV